MSNPASVPSLDPVDSTDLSVFWKKEVGDLHIKECLPLRSVCSKKLGVGLYQAARRTDWRPHSPSPWACPALPLLFWLQLTWIWSSFHFFVLCGAKINFSAKQLIKSNNYADDFRAGLSPALLQFFNIESQESLDDPCTHVQLESTKRDALKDRADKLLP